MNENGKWKNSIVFNVRKLHITYVNCINYTIYTRNTPAEDKQTYKQKIQINLYFLPHFLGISNHSTGSSVGE